jgi:hypothetical protein
MERINLYTLYDFGKTLRMLESFKDHNGDIPRSDIFLSLLSARHELAQLLEGKPIPIQVSRGPVNTLLNNINEIWDEFYMESDESGKKTLRFPKDSDSPIPKWKTNHLSMNLIPAFETVFNEEMREAASYFVPKRGLYHTPLLVDSSQEIFPAALVEFIPEKTLNDWKASGRCLAFAMNTAVGFHVARAVEGMLSAYFKFYTSKDVNMRSWGNMEDELARLITKNSNTPIPSKQTLGELKQLREDFRNPVMHPRVILEEADAHRFFMNGASIIIAMAQDIKNSTKINTRTNATKANSTNYAEESLGSVFTEPAE